MQFSASIIHFQCRKLHYCRFPGIIAESTVLIAATRKVILPGHRRRIAAERITITGDHAVIGLARSPALSRKGQCGSRCTVYRSIGTALRVCEIPLIGQLLLRRGSHGQRLLLSCQRRLILRLLGNRKLRKLLYLYGIVELVAI